MDIRTSIATQGYGLAKPATRPDPQSGGGQTPGSFAESYIQSMQQTEAQARTALTTGADPHALVQALAQTELAVETAVTLRDKVVEAYQEILRMPV